MLKFNFIAQNWQHLGFATHRNKHSFLYLGIKNVLSWTTGDSQHGDCFLKLSLFFLVANCRQFWLSDWLTHSLTRSLTDCLLNIYNNTYNNNNNTNRNCISNCNANPVHLIDIQRNLLSHFSFFSLFQCVKLSISLKITTLTTKIIMLFFLVFAFDLQIYFYVYALFLWPAV